MGLGRAGACIEFRTLYTKLSSHDDFGTRWLCNKKKCFCPSDWAPHGKSSRKGDRGMTLQQSQKLYALTSTLQFRWGSHEYTSEFHPDRHLDKR